MVVGDTSIDAPIPIGVPPQAVSYQVQSVASFKFPEATDKVVVLPKQIEADPEVIGSSGVRQVEIGSVQTSNDQVSSSPPLLLAMSAIVKIHVPKASSPLKSESNPIGWYALPSIGAQGSTPVAAPSS